MPSSFATVGLIGRRGTPYVVDSCAAVASCLLAAGRKLIVEDQVAALLEDGDAPFGPGSSTGDRQTLGERCDLIVVVGGDGSLLSVGRDLVSARVPVLGVNRGGLGFLADIPPDQIESKITEVLEGKYSTEDHFLLDAVIMRNGVEVARSPALNDVVVHLRGMSRMMEFELWVNDEFVYDQRSDGLIIASPTGSTAYSLSAGGPIMHPSLDAIVIVPMFPHTLTSRPLVVPGQSELKVVLGSGDQEALLGCDSQVDFTLEPGDEVLIRKLSTPLSLLYPLGHSFFDSCRSKLDWASRLGGRQGG
jgi:NAD+ kinase